MFGVGVGAGVGVVWFGLFACVFVVCRLTVLCVVWLLGVVCSLLFARCVLFVFVTSVVVCV